MKIKLMFLSIIALLVLGSTQSARGQVICATCPDNYVTGVKASAFGDGNNVSGAYSLVAGRNSIATRPYSYVIGSYSGAEGLSSITIGNLSFAKGDYSYVFGNNSLAEHEFSLALGHYLNARGGGFVIGRGKVDAILTNQFSNTLMIGFNSDKPTLFVSETRYGSQSGNVGIGNITDPQAKLHIRADVNEHATLKIEAVSNDRISQIDFGNYFLINAGKNENMKFYTPAGKHFVFHNGNIGVGIHSPADKLDVNGNIRISGSANTLFFDGAQSGKIVFNRGSGSIGTADERLSLNFFTGEGNNRMTIDGMSGNVGIWQEKPGSELDVNGTIRIVSEATELRQLGGMLSIRSQSQTDVALFTSYGLNLSLPSKEYNLTLAGSIQLGASDSDPKIGFKTGHLRFIADNIERMRIKSNGNVGIGTTDPEKKLVVNGDIEFTGELYKNGQIFSGSNWTMSGNNIYRNTGNVGIGTDNPQAKLQVQLFKAGSHSTGYNDYIAAYAGFGIGWDGNQWRTHGDGANNAAGMIASSIGGGKMYFYTFPSTGASSQTINDSELNNYRRLTITNNGNVGIGTTSPEALLHVNGSVKINSSLNATQVNVNGTIYAKQIRVRQNVPNSDHVFKHDYNLMPLRDVELFIREYGHLPEVPSASEFQENGYLVGDMDDLLLRKVEELTLYIIELNKRFEALELENSELKSKAH